MDFKPFKTLFLILFLTALSPSLSATSFEQGREAYLANDYATALEILTPLAEKGEARAQIALAIMYENGHGVRLDIPVAMQWYEKAANQGLPIVQHDLGVKYFSGRGIPQDYSKAVHWWNKSAKQGVVESQYNLGLMYSRGLGVSKDESEAQHWFRLAAEKGHKQAQYSLAVMYAFGQGLRKDETKALHWFQQAAEQGMPEAQYNLGLLFENGQGTAKNQTQAISWYRKAAAQGLSRAHKKLSQLGVEAVSKEQTSKPAGSATITDGVAWILGQNPEHYTLQLSSGPDESGIIKLLNDYSLDGESTYFKVTYASGAVRYSAIHGVFETLVKAELALKKLPAALQSSKPWIRKFGILQKKLSP